MSTLLPSRDERSPDRLLAKVKNGCSDARNELLYWVYDEALTYFTRCVSRERLLTTQEAEDLAGECVLEFNRAMDRVRLASHYARRMFKNNLMRHLRRKRTRMHREVSHASLARPSRRPLPEPNFTPVTRGLDDGDRRRLETARRCLSAADDEMQTMVDYRLAAFPLPYRVIGELLGASETALRMRMTRFCRAVRRDHLRAEKRRAWRMPDRSTRSVASRVDV